MFAHAKCPKCAHEFVVEFANRSTTQKSMRAVEIPVREGVVLCKHCGFVEGLHRGADNVAATHGCTKFEV